MSNLLDFFKNETLAFSFFIDTWLIAMFTEDELKAKLKDALADEAYEKAAKIRDELSRRKSS